MDSFVLTLGSVAKATQDVDIVRSLENTLTILNHKLKRGVEVRREYQPTPMLVNSYGSELSQVWTNLILNAIEAMQGKGILTVRTYRTDDSVVVEIADNGPGISPEAQSHVFEPFFTTKAVGKELVSDSIPLIGSFASTTGVSISNLNPGTPVSRFGRRSDRTGSDRCFPR
jgi:signal transduction histidine kinase